jgi:hypothetical protein
MAATSTSTTVSTGSPAIYGLVADNIVQHNYANGIKLAPDAQAVRVVENTVDGNGRSGILVGGDSTYSSSNNIVANNILTNNGWSGGGFGLRTYWESLGVGIGNQAYSNLLYGNASGTIWSDFGLTVLGSLLQDPLFINRTACDFHISAASPAVDAAATSYTVSPDYAGTPRPQGAGPDIGAYER